MKFTTGLRAPLRRRIEVLEHADIVVGIPSYNNSTTIARAVTTLSVGISEHFPRSKCLIIVSDGGSTDDTREEAGEIEIKPWIEKAVTIYRGLPGKGSAVRAIFETAEHLDAEVCLICDADIRSITPEWVKNFIDPILSKGYQFVTPYYKRHKYDATITNNIAYNLTRALYGCQIRQPIGGDFAFSKDTVKFYLDQDVWQTDVALFGIDIWLTTMAIVNNFKICQARLGAKTHDVKDPSKSLGPMFIQVVGTLFALMEEHYSVWKEIKGSRPVEILGKEPETEPENFQIDVRALIRDFKEGMDHFGSFYKKIIGRKSFEELSKAASSGMKDLLLPTELWVKILYDFAATFHRWRNSSYKNDLIRIMSPLYFARIASFVNQTREMSGEETEEIVQEQARMFEEEKAYLLNRWKD